MKVWITLLIVTITSGCAGNQLTLPLCLTDRPVLEDISVVEQLAIRDISKQFEAECP
jgi:hypothetical protein